MDGRVPPKTDFGRPPLWVRITFLVLEHIVGAVSAVSNNPSFKLAWAVTDFIIYMVGKIPFLFRCFYARAAKRVWRDCVYGPRPRNRLDVYFPDPTKVPDGSTYGRAILLFVHGGAWYWGDKLYFACLQSISFPDCTVVAINYTLHPDAACDLMVQDISLAIRWTVQNLVNRDVRWWTSPETAAPLAVVGHSAGAHLAALALMHRVDIGIHGHGCAVGAIHRRECDSSPWSCSLKCPFARRRAAAGESVYGWNPADVACFVGLSGVYQISDHFEFESERGVASISPMCGSQKTFPPLTPAGLAPPVMGADRGHWDDFSPTAIVRSQSPLAGSQAAPQAGVLGRARTPPAEQVGLAALPAVFLFHGTEDKTVPVSSSVRLFEACKARGVGRCALRYVAGGDHSGMLCMDLTEGGSAWGPVLATELLQCPLAAVRMRRAASCEEAEEEGEGEDAAGAPGPVPMEPVVVDAVGTGGLRPVVAMAVLGAVGAALLALVLRCVHKDMAGGGSAAALAILGATLSFVGASWLQEVALHSWILRLQAQRAAPYVC